jgi:DNA-binding NtrC family response regulator
LAEGAESEAETYRRYLEDAGLSVSSVATGSGALEALRSTNPLLLVLDLNLPDMCGLKILHHTRCRRPPCSTIVTTKNASISGAIEAVRAGAVDYLVKPFNERQLVEAVRGALGEVCKNTVATANFHRDSVMIGSSRQIGYVYGLIDAAAPSGATVFITGESGTGKEIVAKLIHTRGKRRDRPFVAINCSALPKDLVESELFGHVRGAFTGAVCDRRGAALQAEGGTLFLDEVCEMSVDLQAKLLRFLQEGAVRRVGASTTEKVDVRIICATNRDPIKEVRAGRFREDLFYRLYVIPIHLPPLRERATDAIEIARSLLVRYASEEGKRFVRLAPCAEASISAYPWPGNVRQLQNVLRLAVVLNDGEELTAAALPELDAVANRLLAPPDSNAAAEPLAAARECGDPGVTTQPGIIKPLEQVEREAIEYAIEICGNNISRAAAALGVNPSTIYRKQRSWGSGSTGDPGPGSSGSAVVPIRRRIPGYPGKIVPAPRTNPRSRIV